MLHATLLIVLCLAAVANAGSPINDGQSCSAEGGGFQCINYRKMVRIIPSPPPTTNNQTELIFLFLLILTPCCLLCHLSVPLNFDPVLSFMLTASFVSSSFYPVLSFVLTACFCSSSFYPVLSVVVFRVFPRFIHSPLFHVFPRFIHSSECCSTIAMEEQIGIARVTIGGAIVRITMLPPVSAIRPIAKTPTGRNFAPKALGKTLVLR